MIRTNDPASSLRPEIETEMLIQRERARRRTLPAYLRVRVADVRKRDPVMLLPSTLVGQTIRRLASSNEASALVVNANDRLVGIVTLADLLLEDRARPIADIMSSPEVLHSDDSLSDALRWMLVRDFSQVPIVDDERRVLGLVRIDEVLREITSPHARHIATRPADPARGYSPRYGG